MAIVQDYKLPDGQTSVNGVVALLTSIWNFPQTATGYGYTDLFINEAKTIGIRVSEDGCNLSIVKNGTTYHATTGMRYSGFYFYLKLEKTTDALIISAKYGGDEYGSAVKVTDCHKIIIHNAINPKTNTTEQVISYMGNNNSSNVSAMYASDVFAPVDMSEQNGGANVSSAQSVFVQLCNKASDFIATDVYKCLCTSLSSWSFSNAMINGHKYRMSGSIYALDE